MINKRRIIISKENLVLTNIYHEDVNMVAWKRDLEKKIKEEISNLLQEVNLLKHVCIIKLETMDAQISKLFDNPHLFPNLIADIKTLIEMFCYLFEINKVGFRFIKLDNTMCPKFHVDHVPCRLITTYAGKATQFLPHHAVDRSQEIWKKNIKYMGELQYGDVGLFKGENWVNNENYGIVHRSPNVLDGKSRLLLTLDFID